MNSTGELPATKTVSQDDYLAYLRGIATKIDASGIAERYRPVALQLMAKPFYYAKSEGVEEAQKNEEKVIPLIEIAKMYNLTIKGDELLIPKGGMGDDYKACLELLRKHGYKYGGKGSYKFVKVY